MTTDVYFFHIHQLTSNFLTMKVWFVFPVRSEMELLLQRGVKFEIEALSVHSLSFLSEEYIPSKIQGGVHI